MRLRTFAKSADDGSSTTRPLFQVELLKEARVLPRLFYHISVEIAKIKAGEDYAIDYFGVL